MIEEYFEVVLYYAGKLTIIARDLAIGYAACQIALLVGRLY